MEYTVKTLAELAGVTPRTISKSKIKGEGPNAILCIEVENLSQRRNVVSTIRGMQCVKYVEIL